MTRKSSSSSSCTKRICTPAGRIVPKETPESVSSMSTEPLKRVGRKDRPTVLAEAGINVRPAISTDAGQITELANTAFMEDGVYKDPEKIDQFTVEQTLGTIKEGEFADETGATAGGVDVRFLVAEEAATAHMPASDVKRLAGCVLVVMPLVLPQVLESLKHPPPRSQAMEASFGMLAVSPAFWNSVAGDLLVKAAEEFILQNGETTFALSYGLKPNGQILRIAIAVVNIRSDAVAFYSKHGYRSLGDEDQDPAVVAPEFAETVGKDWTNRVKLRTLYKDLELGAKTDLAARFATKEVSRHVVFFICVLTGAGSCFAICRLLLLPARAFHPKDWSRS
eukprot:gnl/TRDRNA2_/TRDRNA2_172133_c0_seq5.p1 gnl/TRDRNA2_/TRDRNA2_172133_c0~~gnl/TRDRNA2_/TRDRNA2_172133_c0_seq5.p1  ORF type:complete len:337 (+),score=53.22 gnl/TRDRNA2_/TRDRNA2_172133_c0_seq5:298-1308(+)